MGKKVHVAVLIDQSGSMMSIRDDVIGGFNAFLEEQKDVKDDVKLTLTLFNTIKTEFRNTADTVSKVKPLANESYCPAGATPLLDAIGNTINIVAEKKKRDVLFVIMTDGYENSSREFSKQSVKQLIEDKRGKGWKFLYLGADLDSMADAYGIGIRTAIPTSSLPWVPESGTVSRFGGTFPRRSATWTGTENRKSC